MRRIHVIKTDQKAFAIRESQTPNMFRQPDKINLEFKRDPITIKVKSRNDEDQQEVKKAWYACC